MEDTSIADLETRGLTPRIIQALDDAGILWWSQLETMTDAQILGVPNLGPSSLLRIRSVQRMTSVSPPRRRESPKSMPCVPARIYEDEPQPFDSCRSCDLSHLCAIYTRRAVHLLRHCRRQERRS